MIRTIVLALPLVASFLGTAHAADALANPAADLCRKDGAKVEIETAPNGGQQGICVFPSGSRITAWAYFRNKHRTQH